MASVRQLKEPNREGKRPWVVEYTDPSGKRRRATPKSGLKKDADKLRQKIEREVSEGVHTASAETVTWEFAVKQWILDCQRRWTIKDHMSGNTLKNYSKYARIHLIPMFGKRKLNTMEAADFQKYMNEMATRYARNYLVGLGAAIRQVLKYAVASKWLTISPLTARPLRIPGPRQKERAIPNKQELRAILEAALVRRPKEYHQSHLCRSAMVVLAIFAGLRRGEVFGLQWESVDLDNRLIHVRHSMSNWDGLKGPKSAAGIRTIPMAEPVHAVLSQARALAGPDPTGFVLTSVRGKPMAPTMCWRLYQTVMQAAGLVDANGTPKYAFHTLRHANVAILIDQGLDAYRIKGLIGHGSINVTLDVYGHLFPDDGAGRKAIDGAAHALAAGAAMPVIEAADIRQRGKRVYALPAPARQECDIGS